MPRELGDAPLERVRLHSTPGEATERDLLEPDAKHCELIDGTLVEKPRGAVESMPNLEFGLFLGSSVKRHRLGIVRGLAAEVLSKGNTKAEMRRKLRESFEAGVRLAWLVDPKTRTVLVHTSPKASTKLAVGQILDGGDVLPGFALPLADLFECLDRRDDWTASTAAISRTRRRSRCSSPAA